MNDYHNKAFPAVSCVNVCSGKGALADNIDLLLLLVFILLIWVVDLMHIHHGVHGRLPMLLSHCFASAEAQSCHSSISDWQGYIILQYTYTCTMHSLFSLVSLLLAHCPLNPLFLLRLALFFSPSRFSPSLSPSHSPHTKLWGGR